MGDVFLSTGCVMAITTAMTPLTKTKSDARQFSVEATSSDAIVEDSAFLLRTTAMARMIVTMLATRIVVYWWKESAPRINSNAPLREFVFRAAGSVMDNWTVTTEVMSQQPSVEQTTVLTITLNATTGDAYSIPGSVTQKMTAVITPMKARKMDARDRVC